MFVSHIGSRSFRLPARLTRSPIPVEKHFNVMSQSVFGGSLLCCVIGFFVPRLGNKPLYFLDARIFLCQCHKRFFGMVTTSIPTSSHYQPICGTQKWAGKNRISGASCL